MDTLRFARPTGSSRDDSCANGPSGIAGGAAPTSLPTEKNAVNRNTQQRVFCGRWNAFSAIRSRNPPDTYL